MKKKMYILIFTIPLILLLLYGLYYKFINSNIEQISKNQLLKISLDNKIILDDKTLNSITLEDKDGQPVAVYAYVSNDKQSLMINPPIKGYVAGEKYTLNISPQIHLESGKLPKKINRKFIVSSTQSEPPKKVFKKAEVGDIIGVSGEFMGYKYDHYGIYIGNNKVIHYYSTTGKAVDTCIKESDVNKYFRNGNYFVLQFQIPSSISKEDAVKRAKERIGENQYDLLQNNCEHFAVWCRTNETRSYQIDNLSDIELAKLKQLTALGLNLQ